MSPRLSLAVLSGFCVFCLVLGDVTDRFQAIPPCLEFFYRGQPPSGFVDVSQSRLCQRLSGSLYYATLYDRSGRIPVYSAFLYKYRAEGVPRGKGVDRSWKYEVQLANNRADGNMSEITPLALRDPAVRRSQVVAGTYPLQLGGLHYVRGQLNPANFQGSRESRSATFALTNAVPYPRSFHHHGWKPALRRIAERLREECQGSPAYLVSGAMRQKRGKETWAPPRGAGRAAVPQFLWISFCCANGASGAMVGHCRGSGRLALGAMELGSYETRELSVGQLEGALAEQLGRQRIRIYQGGCALSGSEN